MEDGRWKMADTNKRIWDIGESVMPYNMGIIWVLSDMVGRGV